MSDSPTYLREMAEKLPNSDIPELVAHELKLREIADEIVRLRAENAEWKHKYLMVSRDVPGKLLETVMAERDEARQWAEDNCDIDPPWVDVQIRTVGGQTND